jgi:hypothetical protein
MYLFMVLALMLVFPLTSIAVETLLKDHGVLLWTVFGKWWVFWAVGVRLLLAGIRQIVQPRYTAEAILGIDGEDVLLVVRELGFANAAIGTIGVGSLFFPDWVRPAAMVGMLFYGLAGINHLTHKERNFNENIAMTSDIFSACVMLSFIIHS